MKFHINRIVFFSLLLNFIFSCRTPEIRKAQATENIKILRLTYDATWSPKIDFLVRHSGSINNTGNTYTIEYKSNEFLFPVIRISSTDQENKHSFQYLMPTNTADAKVFYFPWQKSKSSVILQNHPSNTKTIYCRWEGIYNGFLIVVEGEMPNGDRLEMKSIANLINSHVIESLSLY